MTADESADIDEGQREERLSGRRVAVWNGK